MSLWETFQIPVEMVRCPELPMEISRNADDLLYSFYFYCGDKT